MAYIELVPVTVTPTGLTDPWNQVYNILSADNVYAICPSGNINPVFMEFYGGSSSNPLLPTDSVITGIEVIYSARTSGVSPGTSYLDFYLYNSNTRTQIGSAIRTAAITTTETASSVGSSTNKFNFPLEWIDINTFGTNGRQIGQQWFGLAMKQYQATNYQIWVDNVSLRVHYTTYNYLVGSRTKFHLGRSDLGTDVVMVNGVTDEVSSYIKRKDNGTSMDNQVRAHDVNLLGDALYNIESSMLSSSGYVYALDLQKTYVFSITVSAQCDSSNPLTNAVVFANLRQNGTLYTPNLLNISSSYRSTAPHVSGSITCYWTSAIAWIEHPNRTTTRLYASAQAARFTKTLKGIDFIVGVSALGSAIGTVEDYDTYEGTPGVYQGYIGSLFTSEPASGKIFFKIFAMGRES
jgi:hypothetical protein